MKKPLIIIAVVLVLGASFLNSRFPGWEGGLGQRIKAIMPAPAGGQTETNIFGEKVKIVSEESVVINVVKKVSPSVVSVAIIRPKRLTNLFEVNPFDPFGFFGFGTPSVQSQGEKKETDIGTGFIVYADGTIVTNKHVVSETDAKYTVITNDGKKYEVKKIYRDPVNDLAIIKIDAQNLPAVELGDSSKLEVGQMAIAIGTALGEFRNTVTTGVVSGLGRGITAGDPFGGSEKLDDVIQTSAAINPGNSGGPLLSSAGQVIGVNVAVAGEGQNIGFAIPINIVRDSLDNFNRTGKFSRPYLGIKYRMVTKQLALLNEVPEGAYVQEVVKGSPAAKAGIEANDIIVKFDGQQVKDNEGGFAKLIGSKKVGDKIKLVVWREEKELEKEVTLEESGE
ncbi:MAG: trypsin-like peptidase domain-containing protein [bacterium]|nr:trypsin-like peptidase domain-containing protein [bacterium]